MTYAPTAELLEREKGKFKVKFLLFNVPFLLQPMDQSVYLLHGFRGVGLDQKENI